METTWKYLQNQFLVVTRDNYKKALKLSNYHDAMVKKLKDEKPGQPEWAIPYDDYHPLHVALNTAYTEWKNSGGQQEGQTLNVEQLLVLLKTKVGKWDAQVQVVYEKSTPEYKAIFPNGRYPFNSGEIQTRITAVETLGMALDGIAPLAATKTEVDAFYATLDGARDTQNITKGGTKALSQAVEIARVVAMTGQYRNLGYLMYMFPQTPEVIASFYELAILRNHVQVLFTGTLEGAEKEPVLIHTFVADDKLRLKITGTGTASFYLADTAGGTNSTAVTVTGGAADTFITADAFAPANWGTHRYLTAVNNGSEELHYEIELL